MSLEEFENTPDKKTKRYIMMRSITDLGMGFIYSRKLPGAELPAKNIPKLFPQSGIFLSGCKDTLCECTL